MMKKIVNYKKKWIFFFFFFWKKKIIWNKINKQKKKIENVKKFNEFENKKMKWQI